MWRRSPGPIRSPHILLLLILGINCSEGDLPTGGPPPVENRPPAADAGGPYAALEGSAIRFDGGASRDPDGDPMSFRWHFAADATASGMEVTRSFEDDGTYEVVLVVTDEHGAAAADTTTVTITNAAPAVVVTVSATSVEEGQAVDVSASFSDPGTADAPWAWEIDWGDGTKATGSATTQASAITGSHTFTAGEYVVRVSVTDKDGGSGSGEVSVTVSPPPPGNTAPIARAGGPYTAVEGTAIALDGSGSSDGDGDVITWSWTFTGGPAAATGAQPTRTWADDGTYQVVLVVTDEHGAAAADTTTVTITNAAPAVVVTVSATSVEEGQAVDVSASFSDPGTADAPWAWEIDWGDGTKATGSATTQASAITGSHSFTAAGEYVVRVSVTDKDGDTGTADVAVSVAPPPPPGPAPLWVWSGGQTATGAVVRTRLAASSTSVRLRISTDSLFGSWDETAATATAAGNDVATFELNGLAPDTRYFYRVVSGVSVDTDRQGAFRTLVAPNTPFSFTFALGSCQSTDTNSGVFTHVRNTAPLFWLQTGDIHYRDLTATTIGAYRNAYNALHEQPNQAALYRSTAIVHVWDDHDGAGGNDTDGTKAGWPAARAAYRESLPHHPLPAGPGGAIYHGFVVGRVRFIVSDLRSERSPKTATDNASKTMFGAAQKQHFRDQLALAKANGEFIVWVSTVPWIGAPVTNADYWAGYTTERQEIASYIDSLGVGNRMFALTGDMHASAIDTGENNVWGGFPVFNAGPLDRVSNLKGGPYTWGPVWTNEQFGIVTVTDHGGSTITVRFGARNNATELASHEFTLSLQSAAN